MDEPWVYSLLEFDIVWTAITCRFLWGKRHVQVSNQILSCSLQYVRCTTLSKFRIYYCGAWLYFLDRTEHVWPWCTKVCQRSTINLVRLHRLRRECIKIFLEIHLVWNNPLAGWLHFDQLLSLFQLHWVFVFFPISFAGAAWRFHTHY